MLIGVLHWLGRCFRSRMKKFNLLRNCLLAWTSTMQVLTLISILREVYILHFNVNIWLILVFLIVMLFLRKGRFFYSWVGIDVDALVIKLANIVCIEKILGLLSISWYVLIRLLAMYVYSWRLSTLRALAFFDTIQESQSLWLNNLQKGIIHMTTVTFRRSKFETVR